MSSVLTSLKSLLTFSLSYIAFRENISRGRKKHIWVSVSADLYEDAKRDLSDLGLDKYAAAKCYNLGNYKSQDALKQEEGVMFTTYSTLISKNRLEQHLQWCDVSFDGLIMLDECHRCKSIELDGEGNAKKGSSKSGTYQHLPLLSCFLPKFTSNQHRLPSTAQIVVELQNKLPRARVVYCSATAVSEPKNLGFMSRLGLWGPGSKSLHSCCFPLIVSHFLLAHSLTILFVQLSIDPSTLFLSRLIIWEQELLNSTQCI